MLALPGSAGQTVAGEARLIGGQRRRQIALRHQHIAPPRQSDCDLALVSCAPRKLNVPKKSRISFLQRSRRHGGVTQSGPACHIVWIERCRFPIPFQSMRYAVSDGAGCEIARRLSLFLLRLLLFLFSIFIDLKPNSLGDTGIALLRFLDRTRKRRIALQFPKRLNEPINLSRRKLRRFVSNSGFNLFNGCRGQRLARQKIENRARENLLCEIVGAGKRAARIAPEGAQPFEMHALCGARSVGRRELRPAWRVVVGFCDQQELVVIEREPRFPLGVGNIEPVLQGLPQRRQLVHEVVVFPDDSLRGFGLCGCAGHVADEVNDGVASGDVNVKLVERGRA